MGSRVTEGKQEIHRPGVYKQQNKAHKHGRHRTKGQLDAANKGKVAVKVISKKARKELKRQERRNQSQQIRARKREELLSRKRGLGGSDTSPFLIAVISLSVNVSTDTLFDSIRNCDSEAECYRSPNGQFHVTSLRFKQRFTFVAVSCDDLYAVLDAAKVADTVLFLYPHDGDVSANAEMVFATLFAQGLPATVHAVVCPSVVLQKKRNDGKRNVTKLVEKSFPKEKLHSIEKESDTLTLIRHIGSQKQRSIYFRDKRANLLAEKIEYVPESDDTGTLKISGYVRGQPLSVNRLIHIPFWGTFQLKQIDVVADPRPVNSRRKNSTVDGMEDEGNVILVEKPNMALRETLENENVVDPMEGEQTWPTDEELKAAEEEHKKRRTIKVPKGTSDYQAAWILENEEDVDENDDENSNEEMVDVMEAMDEESSDDDENEDEEEEYDTMTVTEAGDDVMYDERMDLHEEKEALVKFKDARMDEMFPDEVDTPLDVSARMRFQKYRGLKSFRTSAWDPKENLPTDYARLFQFQSFDRTRKRVLNEEKDGAMVGWHVVLHVENFPIALWNSYQGNHPLIVYQPLDHEQKMSVLNMVIKGFPQNNEPIRSKERLVFHVGYRRFTACPVFSQHTNGTKHKFERFFRNDSLMVATVYAPIVFSPCPVLVFKEKSDGTHRLVATGSVLNVNPDRIVGKRAVLSGHPLKINKRSAVIRYMFFNKEDIEWFKPVELRTKCGRRGHIKESLGTHGHMKCYFDGQLQSQDTVLMNLYKRVFPKWTYEPLVGFPVTTVEGKSRAESEMRDADELFE